MMNDSIDIQRLEGSTASAESGDASQYHAVKVADTWQSWYSSHSLFCQELDE